MKKLLLLFFTTVILSCSTSKIDSDYIAYNDNVQFKVRKIQSDVTVDTGITRTISHIATNGRFKTLFYEFKNNSSSDAIIDFRNIGLLDEHGNEYACFKALQTYKVTTTDENTEFKIKPGKTNTYMVTYQPYPTGKEVERLFVNGKYVNIVPIK